MAASAITTSVTSTVMVVLVMVMVPVAMRVTSAEFEIDGRPAFNPTAMTVAVVPTAFPI